MCWRRFDRFPQSLCDLASLRFLDLSDNQIRDVPESISKLQRLESLLLFVNQLERLPDSIRSLLAGPTVTWPPRWRHVTSKRQGRGDHPPPRSVPARQRCEMNGWFLSISTATENYMLPDRWRHGFQRSRSWPHSLRGCEETWWSIQRGPTVRTPRPDRPTPSVRWAVSISCGWATIDFARCRRASVSCAVWTGVAKGSTRRRRCSTVTRWSGRRWTSASVGLMLSPSTSVARPTIRPRTPVDAADATVRPKGKRYLL